MIYIFLLLVVICLLVNFLYLCLIFQLAQRNVTGIQWVASEAWVTASLLTSPRFHPLLEGTLGFSFPAVHIPGLKEFLLNVRPSPEPGMEFVNMFWEELFGCRLQFLGDRLKEDATGTLDKPDSQSVSLVIPIVGKTSTINQSFDENYKSTAEKPVCTGSENLRLTDSSYTDISQVRISYNVYKAVYAIAHALHHLLSCDLKGMCNKNKSFSSRQVS